MTGSGGNDTVTASYAPGTVSFALSGGASFDPTVPGLQRDGDERELHGRGALDSVVLAGLGGNDTLSANGFPQETGITLLGGPGADTLTGGDGTEDLLVDGTRRRKGHALGAGTRRRPAAPGRPRRTAGRGR